MSMLDAVRYELHEARKYGKVPRILYLGYRTYAELLAAPYVRGLINLPSNTTRFTFESYPIYKVDEEYYIAVGE